MIDYRKITAEKIMLIFEQGLGYDETIKRITEAIRDYEAEKDKDKGYTRIDQELTPRTIDKGLGKVEREIPTINLRGLPTTDRPFVDEKGMSEL